MSGGLSSRNVQAIVPVEVHKVLRETAYEKDVPLRDLLCSILTEYTQKILDGKIKMRELSSP